MSPVRTSSWGWSTGIGLGGRQRSSRLIIVEQQAVSPDLTVPADGLRNILVIWQAVYGGEMPEFNLGDYYDGSYLE